MNSKLDIREGWICPKCKEVLSPDQKSCSKCKINRVDEDSTSNDELLLG